MVAAAAVVVLVHLLAHHSCITYGQASVSNVMYILWFHVMPGWKAKCWSRPTAFDFTIVLVETSNTTDTQIWAKFEKSKENTMKKKKKSSSTYVKQIAMYHWYTNNEHFVCHNVKCIMCVCVCVYAAASRVFHLSCSMHFISIQTFSMVCHWCLHYRCDCRSSRQLIWMCVPDCLKCKTKTNTKETAVHNHLHKELCTHHIQLPSSNDREIKAKCYTDTLLWLT